MNLKSIHSSAKRQRETRSDAQNGGASANEAILVMDCGTSGVKSTLLVQREGSEGSPRFLPVQRIPADASDGATGKKRLWQPGALLAQVTKALLSECQRAIDEKLQVAGIALTSTTSSTVSLKGNSILAMPPPLRWDDLQSCQEAALLEEIRRATGAMPWLEPITADSGISKAVWLVSKFPKEFTSPGTSIVEQWTFLNWFLTGRLVQCETIQARKWGWTQSVPWPEAFETRLGELLKSVTFPSAQPAAAYREFGDRLLRGDLKTGGDEIGPMLWRLSEDLGFHLQPRVFAAPFDTFAQIIGMGMMKPSESLAITFGASEGICAILGKDKRLSSGAVVPIPDAPVRGTALLFDGIASCGGAVRYICENYGFMTAAGSIDNERVTECLKGTEPGAQGITMLPYYNGGRRVSRGAQVDGKIGGLNQGKGRANIIRALFESIAFITRGIVNDFERMTGHHFCEVRVSGGPTRNEPFMQILASVVGRNVVLFKQADASLAGCAICAAKGLKWYATLDQAQAELVEIDHVVKPDPAQVRAYERLCGEYLTRFSQDIPLFYDYTTQQ